MRSRQQRTARDVAYIQQYWEPLAATAWAGQLAHGPGAVVIDWRTGVAPQISYADQAELVVLDIPAFVPDLLDHLVDYDPASEVVFVVWWGDHPVGYRLRAAELPPPEAYTLAQQVPRPDVA